MAVVAKIHRFQFVELLAPLLYVGDVGFVSLQEISRAQMDKDFAAGIGGHDLYVFRIAEINFAEFAGVSAAVGIEFTNQLVVVLHAGRAGGEGLAGIHPGNYGEGIFSFPVGREFHQGAAGVDQGDVRSDPGEGDRRALVDFHAQTVRDEAHHAGGFHPGDLLKLRLSLGERDEEDVAADVAAHHFHDLRLGDVFRPGNLNLVAGIDAETPGMLAVAVECGVGCSENPEYEDAQRYPFQTTGGLFREGAAAGRDSSLAPEKRRFLFGFQIKQARVVEGLAVVSLSGKRVQLFLDDSGTRFPGHSFDQLSSENR